MHYMEEGELLYAAGNTLLLLNLKTKNQRPVTLGFPVSAIAVHPTRKYIAIAEKGLNPKIFIHTYPEMQSHKILTSGTTKMYNYLCFSHTGTKLASVGGAPDYMLTLWDWENEKILLRTKAFSQDVYKVTFSPDNEGQLTSSGSGHIKFWKMASTFTGLKLQGEIGKFGKSDLSDIVGYAQLPDGKVISGTETGIFLLWESNFVKCEIWKKGKTPCHQGMVEVMFLEGNELLTAGQDGYIRFWDFEALDNADISGEGGVFELDPLREIRIGDKVQIKSMLRGSDHWLIQDAGGALWQIDATNFDITKVLEFHAGAITGMDTCPVDHVAATAGVDGSVRLVDYHTRQKLFISHFPFPASSLLWAPLFVDAEGRTIVVGFNDGVIRVLLRCEDAFKVIHVSKPHSQCVTSTQYSPDGKILATGSDDCTVFFLLVVGNYSPLGFIRTEGKVKNLSWSPDGQYLLACYENGKVVEISLPTSFLALDVTNNYEIKLPIQEYSPVFAEVPTQQDEAPPPPPAVLCGFYTGDGRNFYLSLDDKTGAILECNTKNNKPIGVIHTHNASCRTFGFSRDGNYLLSGADNGIIHVHPKYSLASFWPVLLHGTTGHISRIATSFDDSYLLSVSDDGNFFVGKVTNREIRHTTAKLDSLPKAELEPRPVRPIEEITSLSHYSIQEAKLRDEQDRLIKLAQEKKGRQRARVEALQTTFSALIEENRQAPVSEQFQRWEVRIDPGLQGMMEESVRAKLDRTRKELAWQCEHKELMLKKMKEHYLDNIETEKITLKAFTTSHSLSSFTLFRMGNELKSRIEAASSMESTTKEQLEKFSEDYLQHRKLSEYIPDLQHDISTNELSVVEEGIGAGDGSIIHHTSTGAIDKMEEVKRKRLIRAKQWEEYYATMPAERRSDLEDVDKIRNALRNTGDYPLKMAKDYRVPENQRINAEKKKHQKLFLEASFYDIKEKFNKRILALRDLKKQVIKSIDKYNQRIMEINSVLGVLEQPFEPTLDKCEDPEKRLEYTKDDLFSFEKRQQQLAQQLQQGGEISLSDGIAAVEKARGSRVGLGVHFAPETSSQNLFNQSSANFSLSRDASQSMLFRAPSSKDIVPVPDSTVEIIDKSTQHIRFQFEKELLQKKVIKLVETFDAALNELRHEKIKIEADMKNAEMKLLVLSKELVLLKEFEKQDVALVTRLKAKKAEKAEFMAKLTELHDRLAARNAEIDQLAESVKVIESEFNTIVPDNHPMQDPLTRIFERQVRRKTRVEPTHSSPGGYDNDDLDDEDMDGDLDEDDEDDSEDVLPAGCDKGLFQAVLNLRERRTSIEDVRGDVRKAVDQIKKEIDSMAKKEKIIEAGLKASENEIQQFQTEKQQKLNALDIVLTLRMSQIQCIVNSKLPDDLSDCLVFTISGLAKLDERMHQLQEEITELRSQLKFLRKEWSNLKKDKEAKKILNKELDAKCVEVQMLKFGQVINLEALEQMSVNKTAEELKARLKMEERLHSQKLEVLDHNLRSAKTRFMSSTSQNTDRLQRLGDLTAALHFLETALDASKQGLVAEYDGRLKQDLQEEHKLKVIANLQHEEIASRIAEVQLLRSKTGKVHIEM